MQNKKIKKQSNTINTTSLFAPITTFNQWWSHLPDNLRGAIYILYGGIFFAIMAAMIKYAGQKYHVTQILFFRQIIMILIILPSLLHTFPKSLKSKRPALQLLRAALAIIAMTCGFTALIHLPLADATSLSFTRSLFITVLAIAILHEKVGWRRWMATCIGFLGVIIMLRPGSGTIDIYALLAIIAAAAAAFVMIIIRLLSKYDTPFTILAWQVIIVGLVMTFPALYFWTIPAWSDLWIFIVIGMTSYIGQMANIRAFRIGEATVIAALDYSRIIYATIIGFLIFSEWPDIQTFLGAFIIIGASFYTIYRERYHGKTLARSAEGRD